MKSTGLGGYLSLINSHSPKTHQNFSFSDTEICATPNEVVTSNEASTSAASTASEESSESEENPPRPQNNHLSKSKIQSRFRL